MKNASSISFLLLVAAGCASSTGAGRGERLRNLSSEIDVFRQAESVDSFFDEAYGYAVFPTIGEGALGVGAAHGSGQVYVGDEVTGTAKVTELSVGWQAGGRAFSQIIFFQNSEAYEKFTNGTFELDAEASAVALTAAAQAQTGTSGTSAGARTEATSGTQANSDWHNGVATFVRVKGGLMYQAKVGGMRFSFQSI